MPTLSHIVRPLKPHCKIVGIGASAGGLEAFEAFFTACPIDTGLAFVLVPHLDPTHASLLAEILQRATMMVVTEAKDHAVVLANCVYIIPPNCEISISQHTIHLSPPTQPHGQRLPIDHFFKSLAESQQENAIGIVLSGTGHDGTQGSRAIFDAGGATFAQQPVTAKYDGMPASVIAAGYATKVMPVSQMPAALVAHNHLSHAPNQTNIETDNISGMARILTQLRLITGQDFSRYKKSTISRRIERRMLQYKITDCETYAHYIHSHPEEAHLLFKELLINVTSFFRDAEAFDVLQKTIIPKLFANKPDGYVFRIWIAGCASGEEAYSIAMLMQEQLEISQQHFTVQIFSTDLEDDAISIARAGVYPDSISKELSAERLQRFFTKTARGYQINKSIRAMIVFAVQNVIKDPPFTKLDLLTCRNMMIYLSAELQHNLVEKFHYALKLSGILFLSPSESIGNHVDLFSVIDRKWKLYAANHTLLPTRFTMPILPVASTANHDLSEKKVVKQSNHVGLAELSRRMLLQWFAPASVMTDLLGNILYVHGETGKYLRPAPGQPTLNIIEMAREGLETELRAAVYMAANEQKATINREIQIKTNDGFRAVSLSVRALSHSVVDAQPLLMVSFTDVLSAPANSARKRHTKTSEPTRISEL